MGDKFPPTDPTRQSMDYFEFEPAAPLAAHVSCYWGMTVGAQVPKGFAHQAPLDGCMAIASGRAATGEVRTSLVGPRAEPLVMTVNPGDRFWGVKFWPDAGGAVLHEEPRRLHGHLVSPLTEPAWALALARALAACDDRSSAAAVADAQLAAPVAAAAPLDPIVRASVVALIVSNGEMEIAGLALGVGLSLRQFERRFDAATGLNPVQFARIRRARSALAPLLRPSPRTWSEIAADFGYPGHAELVRDFSALSGLSATDVSAGVHAIVRGRIRP